MKKDTGLKGIAAYDWQDTSIIDNLQYLPSQYEFSRLYIAQPLDGLGRSY